MTCSVSKDETKVAETATQISELMPWDLAEKMDTLQAGDQIHLVVVGSGLTWGGLIFESAKEKDQ